MNDPIESEMSIQYLETSMRFYKIIVMRDLLGDLIVALYWGGKYNRLGGHRSVLVKSIEAAHALIEEIIAYRLKRGYYQIYYHQPDTLEKTSQSEKSSIVKKSDALDPKKYIQMLKKCQTALPHLFKDKTVSLQHFCASVQKQFPEYTFPETAALLKQWLATPIFIGDVFKEDKDEMTELP